MPQVHRYFVLIAYALRFVVILILAGAIISAACRYIRRLVFLHNIMMTMFFSFAIIRTYKCLKFYRVVKCQYFFNIMHCVVVLILPTTVVGM